MRKWTLAAFLGLLALSTAPAYAVVNIELVPGAVSDGTVSVQVVLNTGGDSVGGMQNDILFDSTLVNLTAANQCTINAEIGTNQPGCEEDPVVGPCKTLSRNLVNCGANPSAPGCEGQGANISRFRGIVAATAVPNNNEIPDGTVLYTCNFTVASTPATLDNSNVVASSPTGTRLDAEGEDATIGGGGEPTPTATQGGEPTPTTGPSCTEDVCINVGSGSTTAPGTVTIEVTAVGDNIGGAQNDILFDNTKVTLASAAACRINPAIGTNDPGCEEDPVVGPCKTLSRNLANCGENASAPGCEGQGANISRFRGIVAATAVPNNNPIPSGSVLYTCDFMVSDVSLLPATLSNVNIVASNPTGTRLDAGGDSGVITGGGVEPTFTPTGEVTPPTNTPTVIITVVPPTNTPTIPTVATSTPTVPGVTPTTPAGATRTATATVPGGQQTPIVLGDDDDGCHIAASGSTSSAWILLIPALGLFALRRGRN
ncbi:MAG TPA: hypothetical protein VEB21_10475 [Terriglobales bacterium]|nr:hypothetical protein [Terriglobales bacterium]